MGALAFIVPLLANGALWALSAPGARKLGGAGRFLARTMIGEDVPPPAPMRPRSYASVRTPSPDRLAVLAEAEGAKVRVSGSRVRIIGLPAARIAQLTEGESVAIHAVRPESKRAWMREAVYDRAAWQARLYFGLKLPLGAIDLLVAAGLRLAGLAYLTYPIWWQFARAGPWLPGGVHTATQAASFLLLPAGAALLLAAPWLTQAVTEADRQLVRGLLGPGSPHPAALAERVRDLEVTRAHAVEDSAARLRSIERDLQRRTSVLRDRGRLVGARARRVRPAVPAGPGQARRAGVGHRDAPRPVAARHQALPERAGPAAGNHLLSAASVTDPGHRRRRRREAHTGHRGPARRWLQSSLRPRYAGPQARRLPPVLRGGRA